MINNQKLQPLVWDCKATKQAYNHKLKKTYSVTQTLSIFYQSLVILMLVNKFSNSYKKAFIVLNVK